MSIEVKCNKCGNVLEEPGGLVFSPPGRSVSLVIKYHICADCWVYFQLWCITPFEQETKSDQ